MWGNPIAEMMFETVRYFAGKSGVDERVRHGREQRRGDVDRPAAGHLELPRRTRTAPRVELREAVPDRHQRHEPVLRLGQGAGQRLRRLQPATSRASTRRLSATTIWDEEIGGSGPYFIGQSGAIYDGAPTPKTVNSFANIRGLSPEAPAKEGSYNAASVAHFGLINDLNPQTNPQNLQTFAVALASPLPKIEIPRRRRYDHIGAVREIRRRLPRDRPRRRACINRRTRSSTSTSRR